MMAYGRLYVARKDFFEEALLVTYRPVPSGGGLPARRRRRPGLRRVARDVPRPDRLGGRQARALARRDEVAPAATSGVSTRNTLMNEPVANLAGRDSAAPTSCTSTSCSPDRFDEFIDACQEIIPPSKLEFLNVTLRYVGADTDSMLSFAPTRRIAAVMSFSQELTPPTRPR